jgi:hypothetical protein
MHGNNFQKRIAQVNCVQEHAASTILEFGTYVMGVDKLEIV